MIINVNKNFKYVVSNIGRLTLIGESLLVSFALSPFFLGAVGHP